MSHKLAKWGGYALNLYVPYAFGGRYVRAYETLLNQSLKEEGPVAFDKKCGPNSAMDLRDDREVMFHPKNYRKTSTLNEVKNNRPKMKNQVNKSPTRFKIKML